MDDDKLQQMIDEIEAGGKLHAPSYLKREIFDSLERKEAEKSKRKIAKKLEFIAYALEVGAVTAAAVALVFMAPVHEMGHIREKSNWGIDAKTRQQISYTLSDVTKKIVTWGNVLLPKENEKKMEEEK